MFIDHSTNWKNRGYDTYVLAAPISISGVEYICETVIAKSDNRTGFYLHEVQIKEKLLDVFKTGVNTGTPRALRSIIALNYDAVKDIEKNCIKIVDENGEEKQKMTVVNNCGNMALYSCNMMNKE